MPKPLSLTRSTKGGARAKCSRPLGLFHYFESAGSVLFPSNVMVELILVYRVSIVLFFLVVIGEATANLVPGIRDLFLTFQLIPFLPQGLLIRIHLQRIHPLFCQT